jgi:hypothetical protein
MVPRKLSCVSRHQINHGDGVICRDIKSYSTRKYCRRK